MAEMHNGINNRVYGKIDSDAEFTMIIKKINELIDQGFPVCYYRDKFNQVRVRHGHTWYTYKELMKHLPNLRYEVDEDKKEYVLEKQWYKRQRSNNSDDFTWEFIYKWV